MRLTRRLLLAAAPGAAPPLRAQGVLDRPVTIVVPFPPGGSVDGVARILAQELGEQTGGTFLVENRAGGAGGGVGSASVLRARPDGTTLLLNASIHVVVPLINRNVTFDVVRDFTHISLVADGPLVVTTHPAVPADSLRGFFDRARAEPGRYIFATTSYGSAGHLCLELLQLRVGLRQEVVAYRGAAPALADLAAGNVHLLADPIPSSLPLVRAGRLRALAVTSAERTALAPEIPTVAEGGMEPLKMLTWYGLWGPGGMDAAVVAELSRRVGVVTASGRFQDRLRALGFTPRGTSPEGLLRFVEAEIAQYRPIVQAAGIRVE